MKLGRDWMKDDTITSEHASVLLERFGKMWASGYDDDVNAVVNLIDPAQMAEQLATLMTKRQFFKLFETDEGKILILGMFFQKFVMEDELEIDEIL